jgi:hypothetical protein
LTWKLTCVSVCIFIVYHTSTYWNKIWFEQQTVEKNESHFMPKALLQYILWFSRQLNISDFYTAPSQNSSTSEMIFPLLLCPTCFTLFIWKTQCQVSKCARIITMCIYFLTALQVYPSFLFPVLLPDVILKNFKLCCLDIYTSWQISDLWYANIFSCIYIYN